MNRKGFTLVELLAVIVVLGTLITLATVATLTLIQRNKDRAVAENIENLKDASISYVLSLNKYLKTCTTDANTEYSEIETLCGSNNFVAFTVQELIDNGLFKDNKKNCNTDLRMKVFRDIDDSYKVLFSEPLSDVCQNNN